MAGASRGTALLFFFALLMHGAVGDLHCIATRNGSRMLYRVLNPPPPSELKGQQCDNWWNKGNTVLASNFNSNKSTLVLRHSSDSLEVSECLTNVSWNQDCWSETTGQTSYAANCSTTCPDTLRGISPTSTDEDGWSKIWIGSTLGILGLIGLVGLISFLVYRFKETISRMLCRPLSGHLYNAGRRGNDDQV